MQIKSNIDLSLPELHLTTQHRHVYLYLASQIVQLSHYTVVWISPLDQLLSMQISSCKKVSSRACI